MSDASPETVRAGRPKWAAWAGFALGLALVIGAVVVVASNGEEARALAERLSHAHWAAVAFILLSPVLNWVLVSGCLLLLQRRHGPVGWGEMNALVGSAWLLNHLPMRAGMFGRIGYHKLVNGIRVRDSVESTVWSLVLAAVSGAMGLGLAFGVPRGSGAWVACWVLGGPVAVVGLMSGGAAALGRRNTGLILGALALRYADMALWAARYAVVFSVLGMVFTPVEIVAVTAVSQIAQLIPTFGGGLGVREWFVGLVAGALGLSFDDALAGDLVNRAAETMVVIPLGLVCGAWVARSLARFRRERGGAEGAGETPGGGVTA